MRSIFGAQALALVIVEACASGCSVPSADVNMAATSSGGTNSATTGTGGAMTTGGASSIGSTSAADSSSPSPTGGSVAAGGISATESSALSAVGGSLAVGGNSATNYLSSSATGGASNVVASGGVSSTTQIGGSADSGGTKSLGGAWSGDTAITSAGGGSGNTLPVGGSAGAGETGPLGGASATGGMSATGGVNALGGSASTGGTLAVGGSSVRGSAGAVGSSASCGDGNCDSGEDSATCCADCGCSNDLVCFGKGCIGRPTAITARGEHTCVLHQTGEVSCWGSNSYGELGIPTSTAASAIPLVVPNLSNVTAVAAGSSFTCALLADSSVDCWGANYTGQLGTGTNQDSAVPIAVAGLTGVKTIAAGLDFSCGVLFDGTARCWGSNSVDQLGVGTITSSAVPVPVSNLTSVTQITAGAGFACALTADGSAKCWGNNNSGQLGNASTSSSATPVSVSGLTGATRISASCDTPPGDVVTSGGVTTGSACAVMADGTVNCWGSNWAGQLGNGNPWDSHSPTTVKYLAGAKDIAEGYGISCAVADGGLVACWGSNFSGALGDGTTTDSTTPVAVSNLTGAVNVAVGDWHACALLDNGSVECWGANIGGCLGYDSTSGSSTPVKVSGATSCASNTTPICKNRTTLRSCIGGSWVESKCGNSEFCRAGTCQEACPDLVAPANATVACYMPYDPHGGYADPLGTYNGAPNTASGYSADPIGLPVNSAIGAAFDTLDQTISSNEICAAVESDAINTYWQTPAPTQWFGRIYLWGYLELAEFKAKHGGAPLTIALYVKARKKADTSIHIPVSAFTLQAGTGDYITKLEDISSQFTLTTDWAIYSRSFTTAEIASLSLDGSSNRWELDFTGGYPSTPPENVEVAWYALTLVSQI